MAANDEPAVPDTSDEPRLDLPATRPSTNVLSGAQKYADGAQHVGVAILVTSDGNPSTLMIPDVTKVKDGAPVYITKPVRINGKNLTAFLDEKGIELEEKVKKLIGETQISCEAFYYSKDGPFLMMFAVNIENGLISNLTGEEALGKLFDVTGASLRILKCPEPSFGVLEKYAAELSK